MDSTKYYIVELIEGVNKPWNDRVYNKGVRVMVWEEPINNDYWIVNTNDNFKTSCAKKIYEFKGEEVRL